MEKQTSDAIKSITGRMLKSLVDQQNNNERRDRFVSSLAKQPVEPAAEYQDNGGGYNPTFVIPQK